MSSYDEWLRGHDQWIHGYDSIVELYHNESDRAAAVLAGSVLEKYLGDHIRLFLVDHPSVDELFRGYGPFSSFAARINTAFALGLLTEKMRDDCNYIRKIRNHFSHHPAEASFLTSPVRELCANLSTAKPIKTADGSIFHQTEPRLQYLLAVGILISGMYAIIHKQHRREIPDHTVFSDEA
jgi:hypothetical protein